MTLKKKLFLLFYTYILASCAKEVEKKIILAKNELDTENIENSWISYWQSHGNSEFGSPLLTTSEFFNNTEVFVTDKTDLNNAYINLKLINNKVIFYTGFAWLESKQFNPKQEWEIT